jgi:hypothetical protein
MLPIVPFNVVEYERILFVSEYLCIGILSFQILVLGAYFLWWKRSGPRLPRHPDTLAGAWSLLAESQLARQFDDLSMMGRKDLIQTVQGWKKTYYVRWRLDEDGKKRIPIVWVQRSSNSAPWPAKPNSKRSRCFEFVRSTLSRL